MPDSFQSQPAKKIGEDGSHRSSREGWTGGSRPGRKAQRDCFELHPANQEGQSEAGVSDNSSKAGPQGLLALRRLAQGIL
jgi:hypothetical protein